jgi:O-methyltransferase involved in polyketide biosynthesis
LDTAIQSSPLGIEPIARHRVIPRIGGVSETMLWALHNRATEARRPDAILIDPDSIRIHAAIDYDFTRHFGNPTGTLAARAAAIDNALKHWIKLHPNGTVVSLGEGLETQVRRVDNGRVHWLSVDLPAAIRLREQFLPPTERRRHLAVSALDLRWMSEVEPSRGVFIVAQGLLMYLQPTQVRDLLTAIAERFPAADLVFDAVPRWFSRLTLLGLRQTPHYRLPPMPWGINRDELAPALQRWHHRLAILTFLDYGAPRGLPHLLQSAVRHLPVARHATPSLVQVTIATS